MQGPTGTKSVFLPDQSNHCFAQGQSWIDSQSNLFVLQQWKIQVVETCVRTAGRIWWKIGLRQTHPFGMGKFQVWQREETVTRSNWGESKAASAKTC